MGTWQSPESKLGLVLDSENVSGTIAISLTLIPKWNGTVTVIMNEHEEME